MTVKDGLETEPGEIIRITRDWKRAGHQGWVELLTCQSPGKEQLVVTKSDNRNCEHQSPEQKAQPSRESW